MTDQPKLICEFCVKFIIDGLHFPPRAYILKLSIKESWYSMVWYNSIGASDVDDLIFGSDDQVIYSER